MGWRAAARNFSQIPTITRRGGTRAAARGQPEGIAMSDTAIIAEDVDVLAAGPAKRSSPFSWSAAIAGAIAATAVTFLIISLGSGIGLSLASPYRVSPSATTMTAVGAIWLL